jgi:hypothetical protein
MILKIVTTNYYGFVCISFFCCDLKVIFSMPNKKQVCSGFPFVHFVVVYMCVAFSGIGKKAHGVFDG